MTFFSGTDTSTLQKEGNERNCFVSLIVNNEGGYCAAVTRKVQTKSEVTVKRLGKSYEFFGQGSISVDNDSSETTQVVEQEIIEYFMLDVERHEVRNNLDYLDKRFEEIDKKKKEAIKPHPFDDWKLPQNTNRFESWYDNVYKQEKQDTPMLWDEKTMKSLEKTPKEEEEEDAYLGIEWEPDKNKIHEALIHMLTCSFLLKAEGFDLKQWVKKHMENVYSKIFRKKEEGLDYYSPFDIWCDFICEFTLNNYDEKYMPDFIKENEDMKGDIIASALIEELEQFKGWNEYIDDYIQKLRGYVL